MKLALNRLRRKGKSLAPDAGLYVVVPPEYHSLGCLPADQFIPDMMEQTKTPYYAGLLSAAQYHGAAHHRPQEFQVMVGRPAAPIECGKVRVVFRRPQALAEVPVQDINTPRGTVAVSTPDATAFDLIGYEAHIGGLDAVATILAELAAKLDAVKLVAIAPHRPVAVGTEVGLSAGHVGEGPKAKLLKDYVRKRAHEVDGPYAVRAIAGHPRDADWKLIVNADADVEAET